MLTVIGPDIEDDAPQLGGSAIQLHRINAKGEREEIPIAVRRRSGPAGSAVGSVVTWEIEPETRLQPNANYSLSAISYRKLETPHYQASDPAWTEGVEDWSSEVAFTTAAAPRLLTAVMHAQDLEPGRAVTVVFSEPMDIATLGGDEIVVSKQTSATDRVVVTQLSAPVARADHPHLVDIRVEFPGPAADVASPQWRLEIGRDARSLSGLAVGQASHSPHTLPPAKATVGFRAPGDTSVDPLATYRGEATCVFPMF